MKIEKLDQDFLIIGENIHTTRVVLKRGRHFTTTRDGHEAVCFEDQAGVEQLMPVPQSLKKTQDYEEGRVKHMSIAVLAAMHGDDETKDIGENYLRTQISRQEVAGADYLDVNVDEISIKPAEQQEAMQWLVAFMQECTSLPLSIDSSNPETIRLGLEACSGSGQRMMVNSASLERLDVLNFAKDHNCVVIVTAAGESGMPQNVEQRIEHASRIVEAATKQGIALGDMFIDPLYFPISVDQEFGNHAFESIRQLRSKFGPDIHITGGFSNVSFGLPSRRLINDAFLVLAVEAGADSGIVDPVSTDPNRAFALDRNSVPFEHAEKMLLGDDPDCTAFLKGYRKKLFRDYAG